MKILQKSIIAAAAALMLASSAYAKEPIKVGALFPLSGGIGETGQQMVKGLRVMASMINDNGGVLGRKLEIVEADDESTPAVGVSRATEIAAKGVSVVIGGFNSPVTLAVQPVLARADILDITVISKAAAVLSGEGNPLAIRMNTSNAQDGEAVADFIAHKLKAKRVAFLTQNDALGIDAQEAIEAAFKKMNYEYEKVAEEKTQFTQADFRVALTNIRAANPDVTMAINSNQGVGVPAIIRQFKQSRVPGQLINSVGTIIPSLLNVVGSAADGLVSADIYFPNEEPFASYAGNINFIKRTQEMYNFTPDKFSALSATALQIWAAAANEVGSLERTKVAARIRGGKFTNTIMGDTEFLANGQHVARDYLFTVKDSKLVVWQ
jgi:branched-chain amino acid transport system substrate-binding protein